MKITVITGRIPERLRVATELFERRFSYPFGDGNRFHVSHGDGESAFFDAMGESVRFVAERDGVVLGMLAAVLRRLRFPDGGEREAFYLCDLKILPGEGRALAALAAACARHCAGRNSAMAYGVVMDGTAGVPGAYSGRCGIPVFSPVASAVLWRVATRPASGSGGIRESSPAEVDALFPRLSPGMIHLLAKDAHLRSITPRTGLISESGDACGILEDTRRGKRLVGDDGREILAAHLSKFAAAGPESAHALLSEAACRAHRAGFPFMFVSLSRESAERLRPLFRDREIAEAGVTVYGTGFESPGAWGVSSSEI